MDRRLLSVAILVPLAWGMWASTAFQTVAAGVVVFLFGMLLMEEGFSAFTGGALERVLARSTRTLPRSMTFGVLATSLMQSSSLVSVLTISFLSAGLLGLREGIGIIFGANIGTTTGAWLMAGFGMKVKISAYAMPMLVFGFFFTMQPGKVARGLGRILAGVGFLFLGIHFMKEGFEAAQSAVDLARFALPGFQGLVVFAVLGAAATVVMQSSHATLMLIIAALAAQQITYDGALALAIGANVGTTVTAVLGAISANAVGKRLAAAHFLFNVATGIVAVLFLPAFRVGVEAVSDAIGLAPDDWTLRLAVFHSLFNVAGVALMTPLVGTLVRQLERRFSEGEGEEAVGPRYLNDAALKLPSTAVEVLTQECRHLFDNAFEIVAHGVGLHRSDILSRADLEGMMDFDPAMLERDAADAYYARVKTLYTAIVDFAARAQSGMTPEQLEGVHGVRLACRDIARAVKEMTLMMANVRRFARSSNADIRKQYRELRLHVARAVRRLYEIRAVEDPVAQLVGFDRLERRVTQRDADADVVLDLLVRERRITSEMATSLMNDAGHAAEVIRLLSNAAKQLFVRRGTTLDAVREELLMRASPDSSYDETMMGADLLQEASLTGEMRRIERGDHG
jgi:phosphate:Na+ symporter